MKQQHLVLLLDASKSMGKKASLRNTYLDLARKITRVLLRAFFENRGPYYLHLYIFPPEHVSDILPVEKLASAFIASEYTLNRIVGRLEQVKPRPTTPLAKALAKIIEETPGHSKILVITDGEIFELLPEDKKKELKKMVEEKNIDTTIIILGLLAPEKTKKLANELNARIETILPSTLINDETIKKQVKQIIGG